MTEFHAASGSDAAQWLVEANVDWWDLVRYGPPAFESYVRIKFAGVDESDSSAPAEDAADSVRYALATLASHTSTPDLAYAAIWEGWGGREPAPVAPKVMIPNRTMLLFAGPVQMLRDAAALAWHGFAESAAQEPHLVWPSGQEWCLACEVDEEIEFSVGCSSDTAAALAAALPGAVRRVAYGEAAPMYRDTP